MTGHVYVMSSPNLPGWCKVGRTANSPEKRAAQLSTGVPGTLGVNAYWSFDDEVTAERLAHRLLDRWRHKSGDEWFKLEPEDAIEKLELTFTAGQTPRTLQWWHIPLLLINLAVIYGTFFA